MRETDHQRIERGGASLAEAKNRDQAVAGQTLDDLVQLGGHPTADFSGLPCTSNQRCDYAFIIPCKDGCFDRGFIMKAKMKIFIIMSIVICFFIGCASTKKGSWIKCPKCGTFFSTKEGVETFESMRPGATRR